MQLLFHFTIEILKDFESGQLKKCRVMINLGKFYHKMGLPISS